MASGPDPVAAPRRRGSVVWPLLLIAVGSIFLLQNLGVMPGNLWGQIWRLWPLALVLIGVELLLGGRVRGAALAAVTLALLAGGILALTALPWARVGSGPWERRTFDQPLQGATQASVRAEFGAGELWVGALEPGDGRLASLTFEGPAGVTPEPRFSIRNGGAELRYTLSRRRGFGPPFFWPGDGGGMSMQLWLAPEVPSSLRVTMGAAQARLDLSKLKLSQLEVETGASSTWLRLPEAGGATTARLEAGAASVEIELPEGVAAEVRHDGGLSTMDVQNPRLQSTGDRTYRTADYDTNPNRVDLRIETGVTTVTIR
jgi:hypothetical protein